MSRGLSAAALYAFLAVAAPTSPAFAEALPQWLPIQTFDKAFNDAAGDLEVRDTLTLRDCGNSGRYFVCSYSSSNGLGIVAWAPQREGLIEQLAIAVPPCNVIPDIESISAILFHIFHPNRPVATFPRAISAMVNFTATTGRGDHWQDGVSYQLVNRGPLGFGLLVHRTPPIGTRVNDASRRHAALKQQFILPESACASGGSVVSAAPAAPVEPAPRKNYYKN